MNKFKEAIKPRIMKGAKCFVNSKYEVEVRELNEGWTELAIKSITKQAIHDWRDFQFIKNQLCGEDREGIELYPAEERLVDTSNQYYMFVAPKGYRFPFGFQDRLVVLGHKKSEGEGSVQRKFKNPPKDAITVDEIKEKVVKHMQEHTKDYEYYDKDGKLMSNKEAIKMEKERFK